MAYASVFSADGKIIAAGDSVTVMGRVASHTGTGSTASLTVISLLGDSITVPANNAGAPQKDTGGCFDMDGDQFGDADKICVPGNVASVGTANGKYTPLTVTLLGGTSVTVKSGACRSTSQS